MSAPNVLPPAGRPQRSRLDWRTLNPFSRPLYKDLTFQVLAGMVLGVLIGVFLPKVGMNVSQVSDIFIDLITMVTGLIVFCTVTLGIAKVRDFGKVGRIAVKALIYFEVITTLALVIGLVVVNVLRPGAGLHINPATLSGGSSVKAAKSENLGDFIESLVPTSAVGAFAEGNILQVVVFSVLFGCGVATVGDKAAPLISVIEVTQRAVFWIIRQVMKLAPLAACAAIAFSVSTYGLHTLVSLGALLLEFLLTVVLFFVLVLWPVCRYAGVSLLKVMRYIREELLLVIGTSSSESVFPQLTDKLKRLGVEDEVVGLVLPTAYSLQPRRHVPVLGRHQRVPGPGHRHPPGLDRAAQPDGGAAADLEGRRRGVRVVHPDPGPHPGLDPHHPGRERRAYPRRLQGDVGHVRVRQHRRELRRDDRRRQVGERHRLGPHARAARRRSPAGTQSRARAGRRGGVRGRRLQCWQLQCRRLRRRRLQCRRLRCRL